MPRADKVTTSTTLFVQKPIYIFDTHDFFIGYLSPPKSSPLEKVNQNKMNEKVRELLIFSACSRISSKWCARFILYISTDQKNLRELEGIHSADYEQVTD